MNGCFQKKLVHVSDTCIQQVSSRLLGVKLYQCLLLSGIVACEQEARQGFQKESECSMNARELFWLVVAALLLVLWLVMVVVPAMLPVVLHAR
jgi:hypothetical protein